MQEANAIVYQVVDAVIKIKKDKNWKVNFKYDPDAFCDPGIQESDSETEIYGIGSLNEV